MRTTIFVPTESSALWKDLAPGSALVGGISPSGVLELYYEGNTIGACNLHAYEDRIRCAAGRLFTKYPTGAKIYLGPEEMPFLIPVGYAETSAPGQTITVSLDGVAEQRSWEQSYAGADYYRPSMGV